LGPLGCLPFSISEGGDEYPEDCASQADHLANKGWEVLECVRRTRRFGLWMVLLFKPGEQIRRHKNIQDFS